jgi:hypothetical protein
MDMEKLFEQLTAKMDADRKAAQEDFLAKMDANQAKAEAKIDANQAKADADRKVWQEEMAATRKEMEARLDEEKPTSVDREPEAAEQEEEVPEENATVMPVGEPRKKRRKDRNQRNKKKRTQGNDGCQRRLAATSRGMSNRAKVARKTQANKKMSRRATVARRMRDIFRPNMTSRAGVIRREVDFVKNYSTRVNADQETWKGRTRIKDIGGRRPLFQKESVPTKDAIGGCKSEQQSHLGRRGTRKMIIYETVGRQIMKQIEGSSVGVQQDEDWTLWRG